MTRWLPAAALGIVLTTSGAMAGPTLLFDPADGKVLYAEDQDDQWHPASLTKIMTAYLTFEALKSGRLTLEQKITVSENAHALPPSKVGLPVGAEMKVDLAIRALIVKSANDVAVMLAEAIGRSEEAFVKQMNDTALRLGMTRTHFVNPHGLPAPEQITTARDLGKLSRAVLADFPEQASLWALADMQIGRRRLRTHNGLLKTYGGADGLKTGFICDSGYNVVASASRDGRKLVAVVLGESSGRDRSVRAASLLQHGFDTYGWKQMFDNTTIDSLAVGEAKGAMSIRQSLVSWHCNGRKPPRRLVAKKRKGGKPAAAAQANVAAKDAPASNGAPANRPQSQQVKVVRPEQTKSQPAAQAKSVQ
ncbi:MAG: D-alanyl-D-alanine carboxypeptidase family protein [Hyphomicrobiaceae bacterium]